MVVQEVEFAGRGGVLLRGRLYLPSEDVNAPGVVMAHGFSATREMCLAGFAEDFCASGFAVLVYDHRNLGESEGIPRGEINPWAQMQDYRQALGWLAGRPEVDEGRLAVWGTSFSGGEVLALAAVDRRIKAVVANAPLAGMPGVDYGDNQSHFELMRREILQEGSGGLADPRDARPQAFAVVSDEETSRPVFLPQSESREWFLRHGRRDGSRWENEITLVNAFDATPRFDPGVCMEFISPTPLLMVVATGDTLCPPSVSLEAFERAREPKQLDYIEGHHFSAYEGASFDVATTVMREFLKKHLLGD